MSADEERTEQWLTGVYEKVRASQYLRHALQRSTSLENTSNPTESFLHEPRRPRRVIPSLAVGLAVGVLFAGVLGGSLVLLRSHSGSPTSQQSGIPFATPPAVCGIRLKLTATTGATEFKVSGLSGIGPMVTGPGGDLWFIGGTGGPPNGLTEVVGRITPSGQAKLYQIPDNPGLTFDGIAAGPHGTVWFTEGSANKVGRLTPSTGHIDTFPVPLPPAASLPQRNIQTTDIVAGSDGNLWFDVADISSATPVLDGYVGRVTPTGAITLFAVPGGGQPAGIVVGADGNLWSRIAVGDASTRCGAIPGYTPGPNLVRVTPAGGVTLVGENSPKFAGYSVGPDGNHWWMTSTGMMRRTTPAGQVTDFPAFTSLGFWDPAHFVFGPDKNIWYVDGAHLLRMTLAGDVTAYGSPDSVATWITSGPDGRLWFVEGESGAGIGAIRPPAG
jgi:virginiamycin B lyase